MSKKITEVKHEHDIDVFHAFWAIPSGFIASLCCGEVPLLLTLEGSDVKIHGKRFMFRYFVKRALRKSEKVIALSNDLKRGAIALGTKEDKMCVLPDGVDTDTFKPVDKRLARTKLNLPDGFLVLFVGHLFKVKRVDKLIRIAANLNNDFDFRIVVAGDGPERRNLEKMAEKLEVRNVSLAGEIPHADMPLYMAAADVLALPSEAEGLPSCVQEAMACGVPVVASNVGGLPDLITNGVTGYLANNEMEMETYLKQMMSSPELVSTMGVNALEFARQNLSLDEVVKQIEELYASVLERKDGTTTDATGKPWF
jgi:glycosyltransferase involved in cell wall biosynthesis